MLELTVALDCEPVLLKHVHVAALEPLLEILEAVEVLGLGVELHNAYVTDGGGDILGLEWVIDIFDACDTTSTCEW
jgi:hypothetical protein